MMIIIRQPWWHLPSDFIIDELSKSIFPNHSYHSFCKSLSTISTCAILDE